jgi:hypothetical protein
MKFREPQRLFLNSIQTSHYPTFVPTYNVAMPKVNG